MQSEKVDKCVLPGDELGTIGWEELRIGTGLIQRGNVICATKSGRLKFKAKHGYYWVQNNQRKYVPSVEDMVIGIIIDSHFEGYRVDIGSSCTASLSALSFEGATKRNRPNLKFGDVVYARVSMAHKHMEPQVECISLGKKAEGFGELEDGYMFKCSLGLAHRLLRDDRSVLSHLGGLFPYEIAVGMNGRVWVKAGYAITMKCTSILGVHCASAGAAAF